MFLPGERIKSEYDDFAYFENGQQLPGKLILTNFALRFIPSCSANGSSLEIPLPLISRIEKQVPSSPSATLLTTGLQSLLNFGGLISRSPSLTPTLQVEIHAKICWTWAFVCESTDVLAKSYVDFCNSLSIALQSSREHPFAFTHFDGHFNNSLRHTSTNSLVSRQSESGRRERANAFSPAERASSLPMAVGSGWNIYDPHKDFERMRLRRRGWRLSAVNQTYTLCPTYPRLLAVPATVSDSDLTAAALFRSIGRIPVLSWIHPAKRTFIARSAQPLTGLSSRRNSADENLLRALRLAGLSPPQTPVTEDMDHQAFLTIFDARPQWNAMANMAKGGGTEARGNYPNCPLQYLSVDNIHTLSDAMEKLRAVISNLVELNTVQRFCSKWEESGWPRQIHLLLVATHKIVQCVHGPTHTQASDPLHPATAPPSRRGSDAPESLVLPAAAAPSSAPASPRYASDPAPDSKGLGSLPSSPPPLHSLSVNNDPPVVDIEDFSDAREDANAVVVYDEEGSVVSHPLDTLSSPSAVSAGDPLPLPPPPPVTTLPFTPTPQPTVQPGISPATTTPPKPAVSEGGPVLIHCSDGWDRTSQLVALAMLVLDPHYRTFTGFMELIEKEWCAFGHKFADRLGLAMSSKDKSREKEISPVFLLFLHAVFHLLRMFERVFEFTPLFLEDLCLCAYSGQFGNFLANCERERGPLAGKTRSVWAFFLANKNKYTNAYYKCYGGVLPLQKTVIGLEPWLSLYVRLMLSLAPLTPSLPSTARAQMNEEHRDLKDILFPSDSADIAIDDGEYAFVSSSDLVGLDGSDQHDDESVELRVIHSPRAGALASHHFGSGRSSESEGDSSTEGGQGQCRSVASAETGRADGPGSSGGDVESAYATPEGVGVGVVASGIGFAAHAPPPSRDEYVPDDIVFPATRMGFVHHTDEVAVSQHPLSPPPGPSPAASGLAVPHTGQGEGEEEEARNGEGEGERDEEGEEEASTPPSMALSDAQQAAACPWVGSYILQPQRAQRTEHSLLNPSPAPAQQQQQQGRPPHRQNCAATGAGRLPHSHSLPAIGGPKHTRPRWDNDEQVTECSRCRQKFNFFKTWKHHCRHCGHIFCAQCSAYSIPIPHLGYHEPVRVCSRCYVRVFELNKALRATQKRRIGLAFSKM